MIGKCCKKKHQCCHTYREGATVPQLSWVGSDKNGYQDLTGYSFRLCVNRDGYYQDVLEKEGLINDPLSGKVFFRWEPGDLICGFCQETWIEITHPDGNVEIEDPFCINVLRGKPEPEPEPEPEP